MNPNGIIFQLNKREWFYLIECEGSDVHNPNYKAHDTQIRPQDVYGPFPNSLIANTHMSNCHFTQECRLIYQEDLKCFFAEEWDDIQKKITYSRAHPLCSSLRGKQHGV